MLNDLLKNKIVNDLLDFLYDSINAIAYLILMIAGIIVLAIIIYGLTFIVFLNFV